MLVGLIALFFFPEPETNFFAYLGTAIFFVVLTVFLYKCKKCGKGKKL